MTYQETAISTQTTVSDRGAILPIVGGGILALLWGAYTLMIVVHMAMLPLP